MKTQTVSTQNTSVHPSDVGFDKFIRHFQTNFESKVTLTADEFRPLFTTDANSDALWDAYLNSVPEDDRQYHNCYCCRQFIKTYGGLVVINDDGTTESTLWSFAKPKGVPTYYKSTMKALNSLVAKAKVTGVFRSSNVEWGAREAGGWLHFSITQPTGMVFRDRVKTAYQYMAEKKEDFGTVSRALAEFGINTLTQAMNLLDSDSLYRSEKVKGPAQWLYDLKTATSAVKNSKLKANLTWLAVAKAPAGFCHPRSSMIGTLIEDIQRGMNMDQVEARFAAKMHPLRYQRPVAAPSHGNIAAAEKLVEQLGVTSALKRRFARIEDLKTEWTPTTPDTKKTQTGGVFSHLKHGHTADTTAVSGPTQTVTYAKFARDVLPKAQQIQYYVTGRTANFCALTTAEDADAAPILQWDTEQQRNPVAWYVYNGGSYAYRWNLTSGWVDVTAVTLQPSMWYGKMDHQSGSAIFILKDAVDKDNSNLCLFPETLRSELHSIRSTIEAFSKKGTLSGKETASACGIRTGGGDIRLRALTPTGWQEYVIDRFE